MQSTAKQRARVTGSRLCAGEVEAVAGKVAIEAEGGPQPEALHDGEADGACEGVFLVGMAVDDGSGAGFVVLGGADLSRALASRLRRNSVAVA